MSELCSVRLVTEESESVSVLDSEICSLRFDAAVREPVRVLRIKECSRRTEDRLNVSVRLRERPLISEPDRKSEPVSDLNIEA